MPQIRLDPSQSLPVRIQFGFRFQKLVTLLRLPTHPAPYPGCRVQSLIGQRPSPQRAPEKLLAVLRLRGPNSELSGRFIIGG